MLVISCAGSCCFALIEKPIWRVDLIHCEDDLILRNGIRVHRDAVVRELGFKVLHDDRDNIIRRQNEFHVSDKKKLWPVLELEPHQRQ